MKYLTLLSISYLLLNAASINYKSNKSYIPFFVSQSHYTGDSYALYKGSITGDKSKLSPVIKNILKKYGLSHILTPSGIHLSSALLLVRVIPQIEFLILLVLFIYLKSIGGYFSMERMIIFRFIYKLSFMNKSLEKSYVLTLVISILMGHLSQNPLSFIYSMLFWGTIVLNRENPIKTIIYLNLSLIFISSVSNQAINPLSLILNPIFTALFTLIFPLAFCISFLPNFKFIHQALNHYFSYYLDLLIFIDKMNPIPEIIYPTFVIIFLFIFFHFKKTKLAILFLCFYSPSSFEQYSKSPSNQIYNLGHKAELLSIKKNKVEFIDQRCSIKDIRIKCKKKPSSYGGPSI